MLSRTMHFAKHRSVAAMIKVSYVNDSPLERREGESG